MSISAFANLKIFSIKLKKIFALFAFKILKNEKNLAKR